MNKRDLANNIVIRDISDKKSSKIDYFIVLLLILFSAYGNQIFKDIRNTIIPIIFVFILFIKRKQKVYKQESRIFLVFFLFILAYFLKYRGEFDFLFTFRLFSYISLAYCTLKLVGTRFFKIYEDIIYYLAIISLPLFVIETINYNSLYTILRQVQSALLIPLADMNYANVIVFTLNKGIIRNCGFAWEPGAFSQFLSLAIILNLARTNFNLTDKRFWIFVITVLTTLSTTGYLALSVIIVWVIYNKKMSLRFILIPVFIISLITIYDLPFIHDKIVELASDPVENFERKVSSSYRTGKALTLGRFQGLILSYKDFLNHPFIGYGGHGELTFAAKNKIVVFSINGLGDWLAKYGSIGFILMIYLYKKSFYYLAEMYNFKKPIILLGVLFVLGFSYGLLETHLFFVFMLFTQILKRN